VALLALLLSTLLLMLAARIAHADGGRPAVAGGHSLVTQNDRPGNKVFDDRAVSSVSWGDGPGGTEVNGG